VKKSNCIISGIDLGPDTEKVISYAAHFALKTGKALRLLYVIDYLLTPPAYLSSYIEEEKKREESELENWKSILSAKGIETEYSIVLGRLHETFRKVIEENSPELLVIGFKSHLLRPSSSERLIKSLNIPMLVVRGQAAEKASVGSVNIKKILCPVDFSESSVKAVLKAKEYASILDADLTLLHVIPTYLIKEKWAVWQKLEEKDKLKFDSAMHSEAEANFSALIKECKIDKRVEIYQGNPPETICSAAEKEYDLIIMGARGLSYLEGVLIGSTTEAVIKSSPCPVLIVH